MKVEIHLQLLEQTQLVLLLPNKLQVAATNTAVGSTKFTTITSITTSATASGNINIGTIANNEIK